jgi:hypothetical protein
LRDEPSNFRCCTLSANLDSCPLASQYLVIYNVYTAPNVPPPTPCATNSIMHIRRWYVSQNQSHLLKENAIRAWGNVHLYSRPSSRDGLRMLKDLLMLSPHAELSNTSSTSCALTVLPALLRPPTGSSTSSVSRCMPSSKSEPLRCRRHAEGGERVGEATGVIWIESTLSPLRRVGALLLPCGGVTTPRT